MRALGKTPNDPLLKTMTPIQWRLAELNVIEDEKENNEKIKNIIDLGIRLFAGSPEQENTAGTVPTQQAQIGEEPTMNKPDISYTIPTANGGDISVRRIVSTEFDKIFESGGKYKGF